MARTKDQRKKVMENACRDYTLNMHKRLQGIAFKKRSTKAVRIIRKFATKEMHTEEVRIDTQLNRHLWKNGCRNVPRLVRIRVQRTKNEDEDAKQKFYSTVQLLPVFTKEDFKGLQTENK
mmetsp:Transcript_13984/g.23764  ORF Transcript_13984/g.23764 Transcript_13984/m.23764 type:complete len:120 (-) Transcript_13984:150-509(-)|eukprot:CAMPEP_0168608070 /NCGR_PEP_ID=MMETSP0449_2-20121227/421_1 /TAXON_ID=1082188 /ORGANISM="Strombidium rassoulzadegani, Strain ras09" /LENGTH=119 /DNA_ID=CAMNT_0008648011 /DNA_START=43 /DNA_END=402 /DNA_ORIENTATION=-